MALNKSENRIQAEYQERIKWHDEESSRLSEVHGWMKEHSATGAKLMAIHVGVSQHPDDLQKHAKTINGHNLSKHAHETNLVQFDKYLSCGFKGERNDQLSHEMMREMRRNQKLEHQRLKSKHQEITLLVEKLYKAIQ